MVFRNRLLSAAMVSATLLVALISNAGPSVTNGGEKIIDERNPWFIGDAPIRFCIQESENFSLSVGSTRTTITRALDDWSKTLRALRPRETTFKFRDGATKNISTSFTEVSCGDTAELTIILGSVDSKIRKGLSRLAKHTVAFAERTHYDHKLGRARGYVWLAPDRGANAYRNPTDPSKNRTDFWSKDKVLFHVLLHELGHVFGFPHMPWTIMDDEFPALAVRQAFQIERSSYEMHLNRWGNSYGPRTVCGLSLSADFKPEALGLPQSYQLWKTCLEQVAEPVGALPLTARIGFYSDLNSKRADYTFDMKIEKRLIHDIDIGGHYLVSYPAPFKGEMLAPHIFMATREFLQHQGKIVTSKGTVPASISMTHVFARPEQRNSHTEPQQAELTIVTGGEFISIPLRGLVESQSGAGGR